MAKRITLKDLYLHYDQKWYDVNSSTIPVPYFQKKEITNHKYTLSYKQWRLIVITYFKYVVEYLLSGQAFDIPHFLGSLNLRKYKPSRRKIDLNKTREKYGEINKALPKGNKKVVYHNNFHTRGYSPIIKWYRFKKKFPFKWHWRFDLVPKNWMIIGQELKKDSAMINRLQDA